MSNANLQTVPNTADSGENTPPVKKPRKWLTASFNIASGMAVAFAVKALTVSCLATIASPATTIVIAAATAGVATSYLRHVIHNYHRSAAGEEKTRFTLKQAGFGAGFGIFGAGLVSGLDYFAPDLLSNTIASIKNFFGLASQPCTMTPAADLQPAKLEAVTLIAPIEHSAEMVSEDIILPTDDALSEPQVETLEEASAETTEETPAETMEETPVETTEETPVEATEEAPVETMEEAPVETPIEKIDNVQNFIDCLTEQFKDGEGYSKRLMNAVTAAESANPKVAAQGLKDISFFLMNGLDGMPKDPCLAVEFLTKAAENGNIQARIDLAYLLYHGKPEAGIEAAPDEALKKMKEIGTSKAKWFVEQWSGTAAAQAPAPAPAPASVSAPTSASVSAPASTLQQQLHIAANGPIVTVDVTGEMPVNNAHPAPQSGTTIKSGPGMDCKPILYTNSSNIDFLCNLPENDTHFKVGETVKVMVQRPALLNFVR